MLVAKQFPVRLSRLIAAKPLKRIVRYLVQLLPSIAHNSGEVCGEVSQPPVSWLPLYCVAGPRLP